MPKPEIEFIKSANVPKEVTSDPSGLESEQILSHDPKTGDATKILYYAPGYKQTEEPRVHDFWEEVYILEGRLYDRTLQRWIEAGDYACRPPGMVHGPYETGKDVGVKQLVVIRYET